MTDLLVKSCGPMTTIQDRGRFGYQRFGVSPSGAMDRRALALANALVGNPLEAAAIELMNLGGSFECVGGSLRVAAAGAGVTVAIDGKPAPSQTAVLVREGQILHVGHPRSGTFAYLAVGGGFALEPQLGSVSVHLRSRLGGIDGHPLRGGDRVPCEGTGAGPLLHDPIELIEESGPIRVMMGPQDDYFSEEGLQTFLQQEFIVSPQADRMGYQLSGPQIEHLRGFNIVSDGIVAGHVQVPGSGLPIVLMRDRQTAGGYPKIATVISADLDRFAQMRAGTPVRFRAVGREDAFAAAVGFDEWLANVASRLVPVRYEPTTERLLAINLIGGVVSAGGEASEPA